MIIKLAGLSKRMLRILEKPIVHAIEKDRAAKAAFDALNVRGTDAVHHFHDLAKGLKGKGSRLGRSEYYRKMNKIQDFLHSKHKALPRFTETAKADRDFVVARFAKHEDVLKQQLKKKTIPKSKVMSNPTITPHPTAPTAPQATPGPKPTPPQASNPTPLMEDPNLLRNRKIALIGGGSLLGGLITADVIQQRRERRQHVA